jgi:hypothetical protein
MRKSGISGFFTATNLNCQHLLKPEEYKIIIGNSLNYLTQVRRCQVFGFVFAMGFSEIYLAENNLENER